MRRDIMGGLFGTRSMSDEMDRRLRASLSRIEHADADDLLGRDIDVLVNDFVNEFNPASLLWDATTMTEPERATVTANDFTGRPVARTVLRCKVRVPIEGDPHLLTYYSHSGAPMRALDGTVGPNSLTLEWEGQLDAEPEQITAWLAAHRSNIDRFLPLVNNDAQNMNNQMRSAIRTTIERRRQQELQRRKLARALPFPVERRAGAAAPVRVSRRAVRVERRAKTPIFAPEPAMSAQIFDDILRDSRAMATVFERMPGAADLGEEQLRNLILAMLNTNYEGQVAGELFNGSGKTDILVREGDRNVFIAECKFYRGPVSVRRAVDQLLGYLVWRDTKAALLLFHTGSGFSTSVQRAVAAVTGHRQCQRVVSADNAVARSDYTFARADDPSRAIHLALLPFHVPGVAG